MKYKLLILFFFFVTIVANAQLKGLNFYRFKYNNQDNFISFKINKEKYKTDFDIFLSKKDTVFNNEKNQLIHFMIYNNRYLFVGFFPKTDIQIMSSIAYELRAVEKLEIIDLKSPKKKWKCKVENKTCMKNIIKFNPDNGNVTFSNMEFLYSVRDIEQ